MQIFFIEVLNYTLNNCLRDASYFIQVELDVVKSILDVSCQRLCTSLYLISRYSLFVVISQNSLNSLPNYVVILLFRFILAKWYHCPERQLKSIFLPEKVGSAKYEVKLEWKLFLASCVERRNKALAHYHLFNVVHKDIQVVKLHRQFRMLLNILFELSYPAIEVVRLFQLAEGYIPSPQLLAQLYVEKLEKIWFLIR